MKDKLKDLTLDEKIELLHGDGTWHTHSADGKIKRLLMMDGPQGLRLERHNPESPRGDLTKEEYAQLEPTAMPCVFNLANSWDVDAAFLTGTTIADDCLNFGVDIILGPGMNIKRTPLYGRNFEYFSEDPFLTGYMAKAYVEGVQSKGIGTSAKHYCANNREQDRNAVSSDVDERTLREIYLAAFEIVAKAQPWTIMCSYNLIGGVYAAENKWLLKDVLRGEFGFNGLIVSDWSATREPWRAVKASLDLCMPQRQAYPEGIKRALEKGILTENDVDERAQRVVELAEKASAEKPAVSTDKAERHRRAVELAKETFVLLKNEDNILPIKGGNVLVQAWTGVPPMHGGGSGYVTTSYNPPALHELIKQRLPESANVVTLPKVLNWQKISAHLTDLYTQARKSDVVLLCVGNNRDVESESFDRSTLRLLPHQEAMILNTARQNENVVVLLFAGSAVDMSPWIDKVKAVLLVGFAGEGVYEAAADVVCGNACPCGKLSETFPITLEDCPAGHYDGDGFVERYNEGVFVGYRWFDEKQKDVLFPFGHGLSYAKFEYSDLQIKKTGETDFEVSYLITNNSDVDAKEISQVYVGDPISMVPRPKKELKGFAKTFIPAHESRRVTVKLDFRSFAYYSVMLKRWHVEDGEFIISVGASSRDIRLQESVWIEQDETTQVSPN